MLNIQKMATTNRLLYDFSWNPDADAFKDIKRFRAVVKGYNIDPEPTDAEIVEAFESITGKTVKTQKEKE